MLALPPAPRLHKFCLSTGLALSLLLSCATSTRADDSGLSVPPARARIGFERLKFPGDEQVGLIGTSYLVDVAELRGVSVGPAVYGAISGRRGGLFTIGGEAAWRRQLVGPLALEIGLYAGAGGGAAAPQGGGLMLRPHADLLWDFGGYALGVSFSRVRFPNGRIDSTQVGLAINVLNDFRFVPAGRIGTPARSDGRSGLGFDRIRLVTGVYHSRSGTTLSDGTPAPYNIGTLGVRAEQAIGADAYWGLEANAAAQHGVAGYAEYLGTLGYEVEAPSKSVRVGARVGLGAGGGGGIRAGGGLLAKAAVYSTFRLNNNLALSLEAGVIDAPHGSFRAALASAALVWSLDGPSNAGATMLPTRTDFSAGWERYDAARRAGGHPALQADVLKVARYLSPNLYLSGQVHSALAGGAGGYSAALLGVGWFQPLAAGLHMGAELMVGAAGGGGVDSRGVIVQPMAYIGYRLSPAIAVQVGVGQVKAWRGPLLSPMIDATLVFTYGVAGV